MTLPPPIKQYKYTLIIGAVTVGALLYSLFLEWGWVFTDIPVGDKEWNKLIIALLVGVVGIAILPVAAWMEDN